MACVVAIISQRDHLLRHCFNIYGICFKVRDLNGYSFHRTNGIPFLLQIITAISFRKTRGLLLTHQTSRSIKKRSLFLCWFHSIEHIRLCIDKSLVLIWFAPFRYENEGGLLFPDLPKIVEIEPVSIGPDHYWPNDKFIIE